MRVYVELPPGWGPGQLIKTAWERAGYRIQEHRMLGSGERIMWVGGDGRDRPEEAARPAAGDDPADAQRAPLKT